MRTRFTYASLPIAATALLLAGTTANAGEHPKSNDYDATASKSTTAGSASSMTQADVNNSDLDDARKQVTEATSVVSQMKRDPKVAQLLSNAHGVFIVPDYGKAAAIVGAQGGGGVALANRDGKWSNPAFYNIGGVSIGAQAGAAAGSIALLLMSDKAVDLFESQENNFSLDANAGLTVVNYSADAQASTGKGDVVVWSDTEGAFAGASIGVTDIHRDEDENHAYYGKQVSAREILTNNVSGTHADNLRNALATRVASR